MTPRGQAFRTWVLEQHVDGLVPEAKSENEIRIYAPFATAELNFYPYLDDFEILEYCIIRSSDKESVFYLHVLLDDLARARELFGQMADVLVEQADHTTTQVLLCCTSALTTSFFANKMNEVAKTLSLDYEFSAKSADLALTTTDRYGAIMLAPQASHLRRKMAEAHPDIPVFEIPGKIFGTYDAVGALRLLMHALRDVQPSMMPVGTTRVLRDLPNDKRILIITLFILRTHTQLGYRLFDHGRLSAQGAVRKAKLDYRDIIDLLETLGGRDINVNGLDMIGIAVPGVAYHGVVSLPGIAETDYDVRAHIHERFQVPVSVDNNCNVAAVGCYVGQKDYDSVMFYRHELGHIAGGLGTVIDGTLLKGRHNLAGEPKYYERLFSYDAGSYDESIWTEGGLRQIARFVCLTEIALVSPEAIYLAVDTIDDMDGFREVLAQDLPDELIPALYTVDDYVERVYEGELAICLQKLRDPNYRSLGIA